MTRNRQQTWLEVAVLNAGLRQGMKAMLWAITWGVTREALGRDPNVEEVADWWNESVRTTYREQAAFRKAFPTLDTPARIVDAPQTKERFRQMLDGFDKLDADKQAKSRRLDLSIMELGLGPAVTH